MDNTASHGATSPQNTYPISLASQLEARWRDLLARYSGHTGPVCIDGFRLVGPRRIEMCRGCDKTGRSTTKGATLDGASGHHIGRFTIFIAPLANALKWALA